MNKLLISFISFLTWCCSLSVCAQSSSFTFQSSNGTFCNPTTINFTQTSTGSPIGFTWSFGNGQSSNLPNPSTIYNLPGTYTVQLIAVFNDQVVESSQNIIINQSITGTLSADRNYICVPGNILLSATSTGNISSYDWIFGDGTPNVTTTTPSINHNYLGFGNFSATVKATDVSGCTVTSQTNIAVQSPPILGTVSPSSGCIPANVNFTAVVSVPTGGNVTGYLYDYGDGSPLSSLASHTYSAVGAYTPRVSITTNEGCTNTYTYPSIAFGTPPVNHTAYPTKNVYCGSETAVFISKAVNANSWLWDFGDGTTQTINDTVTSHKYLTLGLKSIKVTPFFNGCAGNQIIFSIDIVGVIAGFTYANTCTSKNTFSFSNTSQGIFTSSLWNFGDGSPTSSTLSPAHTYPVNGSYLTTLTVTDNFTGCSDIFTAIIFTATPSLSNPDFSICRGSNTKFTIQNNYTNTSSTYNWNVLGLPAITNAANPYTVAGINLGNFTANQLIINNGLQYCNDTLLLNHPILVKGPNLNFTALTTTCAKSVYNIINNSSAFVAADTIKLWYWNYGMSSANDTAYQPAPIKYTAPGIYNIKLVAKDKNGCVDSLTKQVDVKPIPFLRIFPRNDTLCFGQSATIIAFHSDTLSWSPAATLSCANCDTTIANPNTTTLYFATVNNIFNCPFTDSTLITVFQPFIASTTINPLYVCLNDSIQINALPTGKRIIWSPTSNISNLNIYSPYVSPKTNTTYTAILTDSVGCFSDTTSVDVIIKSLPQVNAGPDKIYPYNAVFTVSPVYGGNVVSYLWTPTGSLNCFTCPVTSGIALSTQQYTIKATSDSGCISKDDITIFVECKYANLLMPSAFTPNRDGLNDIFYPLTRGIKSVKRFAVYNRYGQQVFEAKNFIPNEKTFGWNGKLNGFDQPAGSYVYMLETICDVGEIIIKKDSFLLLR